MKPFLGVDLTTDKKNEQFNGSEFLVQKTSERLSEALAASSEKAEQTIEESKLPLPLRIGQYVCGLAALIIISGMLKSGTSFAQGYQNAPALYWAAGICAVVWLILWLCSKQKSKAVLETDESAQTFAYLDGVTDAVYAELKVPADAESVDVLGFFYKVKDGDIRVCEKGVAQYLNPEFRVFADSENLYLVDLDGKYAFPLSSVVQMHTINKHIRIAGWNKEEKFNKGIYKQYKLTTDKYGCIHCKYYHILEINHNNESWGIYIPCYELPVFEEILK